MNIMINLIKMLRIFVFEIRPRDRLQNDSNAMTATPDVNKNMTGDTLVFS
jgi:hypothetical protein